MKKIYTTIYTTIIATASCFAQIPQNGLLGFWDFSGGSLVSNTGVALSPITTTGSLPYAGGTDVEFYEGGYLGLNLNGSPQFKPNYISISAKVKYKTTQTSNYPCVVKLGNPGNTYNAYVLGSGNATYLNWLGLGTHYGQIGTSATMANVSAQSTNLLDPYNNYVYLCVTYDGQNVKLYENGVLKSTTVKSGFIDYTGTNPVMWVGQSVNGYIDDLAIYNRALSQQEVEVLAGVNFECDDFVNTADLVLHLPFNGNANDVSSTGAVPSTNTGTFVNDKCGIANSAYSLAAGQVLKYDLTAYPQLKAGTNGKLTIACWAKNAGSTWSSNFSTLVEIDNAVYIRHYNDFFHGGVHNANTISGSYGYIDQAPNTVTGNIDNWHFYAFTYDMNNGTTAQQTVYVDGVKASSTTGQLNLPVSYTVTTAATNYLSIGGGAGSTTNKAFTGDIDNVVVYNRVLTELEIIQLRKNSNSGQSVNVKNHFDTNEIAKLYPNPATEDLNIEFANDNIAVLRVINALGEVMINKTVHTNYYKLNTVPFKNGIYFIEITTTQGTTTKKFIKQ